MTGQRAEPELRITLLGGVGATANGTAVDLGGPRQRMLLAMLALGAGAVVDRDQLVDDLWGDDPPAGAWTTLRSYVSRLRRALGGEHSVEARPGGYALVVQPDAIDALRFERLVRIATEALDRRRYRFAARMLDEALGLWAPPFGDLASEPALRGETVRLEERRLYAVERRIEAKLELGASADLVDELERLVAEQPHRERPWRHLMLALYRAERQADALAAFHRAREALDAQLGIEPGHELQALQAAILRQDVAPSVVAMRDRSSIPAPLTSFIGRHTDLAVIADLLGSNRLVTLVGIGGAGKTRLAIEVARSVEGRFSDGVLFVDLAATRDPSLVPSLVAAAMGVSGNEWSDPDGRFAMTLRDVELLLVLDNCEHARAASAELTQWILMHGPDVRVLATSREGLGVPGEVGQAIQPLPSPDADATVDVLRDADAVRLLLERAGLSADAAPGETLRTAARICRDLEGLPLAIELAAARSTVLTLDDIAARLDDRFRFLVSWRRLAPARHRTLLEAMDWSFDLLETAEQELLQRLSVFVGTFRLEAVADVCLGGDVTDALGSLERLVAASLVVPIHTAGGMRFRLLETVRDYAASKLGPAEAERLRRRLAEHMRQVAHDAHLALESPGRPDYEAVAAELPNLRAALAWGASADPALALDTACLLELFWAARAPHEGYQIISGLLERADYDERLLVRGIRSAAGCRYLFGEFEEGDRGARDALARYRALGDERAAAHMLVRIAGDAARRGDLAAARAYIAEARVTSEDRNPADAYDSLLTLARIDRAEGRIDGAIANYREAAKLAVANHDPWFAGFAYMHLAEIELEVGAGDDAAESARAALRQALQSGDHEHALYGFGILALATAQQGDDRGAGLTWGRLLAEVDRGGELGQWDLDQADYEERIRARAGPGFDAAVAEGRRLPFDIAMVAGVVAASER